MNEPTALPLATGTSWNPARPRILVVACSDGRLQEATDEFLARHLGIKHYDRLYVPGGAGALSASGRDYLRSLELQKECSYLVKMHGIERMIALFHGPAAAGPDEALCADYRRKFPMAKSSEIRAQQEKDARELLNYRWQWAGRAAVSVYRCEVDGTGDLSFVALHTDVTEPAPGAKTRL